MVFINVIVCHLAIRTYLFIYLEVAFLIPKKSKFVINPNF
jgi:hypothetical protein